MNWSNKMNQNNKDNKENILNQVFKTIENRKNNFKNGIIENSYTAQLINNKNDIILKKLIEEAGEVIMSSKDLEINKTQVNKEHLIYEMADLYFHSLVILSYFDLNINQVFDELKKRQNKSGLVEKLERNH